MAGRQAAAKPPKLYPAGSLVRVRWQDSAVLNGWRSTASAFSTGVIETVGYVVEDNLQQITVTGSVAGEMESVAWPMTIPRGCVEEVTEI